MVVVMDSYDILYTHNDTVFVQPPPCSPPSSCPQPLHVQTHPVPPPTQDPVRQEVPTAVTACQEAGICVRMVTGDNIHTAQHIARQCGILTATGQAMEGPAFRALTGPHLTSCLDGLQVLARSSPTDKHTLVNALKAQGHVVAVTGDGTNDAPALQAADVGLAMGITGVLMM